MEVFKIITVFDGKWVLDQRTAEKKPVEQYVELLAQIFEKNGKYRIVKQNFTECQVEVGTETDVDAAVAAIIKLIEEKFQIKNDMFNITVEKGEAETVTEKDNAQVQQETKETDNENQKAQEITLSKINEIMSQIDGLIGADEFKELANELCRMNCVLGKPELKRVLMSQRYLFAINDGCGFEKSVELFGELLNALKLFDSGKNVKINNIKLVLPSRDEERKVQLMDIKSQYRSGYTRSIVVIDISEWLMQYINGDFAEVLRRIAQIPQQYITIFRIPYIDRHILRQVEEELGDVLNIRTVEFTPPDKEMYWQYAKKTIEDCKYLISDDMEPVFYAILANEQRDGRFYGFETIDKIIDRILYEKIRKTDEDDKISKEISAADINGEETEELTTSSEVMLDKLTGIKNIKEQLKQIVAQVEAHRKLFETSCGPCMHMRFVGNPGTGKTTIARILGLMLKERGVLKIGRFYEVGRTDLCGEYVGSTTPKTARICRDAIGSVLFIDEAYKLSAYGHSGNWDYGQEAINELVSEMENHRDELVVIMAGYKEEMDGLMRRNAGLASRMPYEIIFSNYSREELYAMFMAGIHKEFVYDDSFAKTVRNFFMGIVDEEYKKPEFCNGRLVRNLYERIWGRAVMRQKIEKGAAITLKAEDAAQAIADHEFAVYITPVTAENHIGF